MTLSNPRQSGMTYGGRGVRDCQNCQDCQTSPKLKGREAYAISTHPREHRASTGRGWNDPGMPPVKPFGILIEARGEGWRGARLSPESPTSRGIGKAKSHH